MQGCSIVFHTASPFVSNVKPSNVQETLLDPAIKGTQSVLKSVAQTTSVKRVVLTSSCFAILTDAADCKKIPGGIVNESVWNTTASKTYNPYAYSKLLAEKEAWKMADAMSHYKLIVINPGWVFGSGLKTHATSESYDFMKMMGSGAMKGGCPDVGVFVVDVRDVAKAQVSAAFTEEYVDIGHGQGNQCQ
mmetsp:Transcript_15034/g.24894  ORF Transcript_15034/g.24894 Transcript_15034/m.24894 type:complete len:190 (-) Transcript_15034:358-927(-)